MNTKKIGDDFEDLTFDIFSQELVKGQLWLNPDTSSIFQKKKYFSKDRDDYIEVDISIESKRPNANDWSLLTVIECKKYNKRVPVDDVEEFISKINQIGAKKVKGIIVSSLGFQKSSLKLAESKGIALVRISENENHKWILNRASQNSFISNDRISNDEIKSFLTDENLNQDRLGFYSFYDSRYSSSVTEFSSFIYDDSHIDYKSTIVHQISKKNIVKSVSEEFLISKSRELNQGFINRLGFVDLDKILQMLSQESELTINYEDDLGTDLAGFEVLGKIEFEPHKISIKKDQENEHRKRFTIAHELGHYFLDHKKYLKKELYSKRDEEKGYLDTVSSKDITRLEWQANFFASHLILPQKILRAKFSKFYDEEGINDKGFGVLYLDNQYCNQTTYLRITNQLMGIFRVSRAVLDIRLKQEGILIDERKQIKKISDSFS